jgi:hypothetical protein
MKAQWTRIFSIMLSVVCGLGGAATALAQPTPADVITVGSVTSSATVVQVPVSIRDVSGTPLGMDQPPGSKIQSFSIKVDYAPTAPVQSITFTRAGITQSLTPTFENSPSSPGSISLIATFDEGTNPIPFTLNGAAPGNVVGQLNVTIAPATPVGTVINLTLDPVLTQLSNQGGTTTETVALTNLTLVNGSITTAAALDAIPTASTWALIVLALAVAMVGIRKLL